MTIESAVPPGHARKEPGVWAVAPTGSDYSTFIAFELS